MNNQEIYGEILRAINEDMAVADRQKSIPTCCLSEKTLHKLANWLKSSQNGSQKEKILGKVQEAGVDAKAASILSEEVWRLAKQSNYEGVVVYSNYLIAEMLEFKPLSSQRLTWLMKEDRKLNKTSRTYKLSKADILARVLADDRYKSKEEVEKWVLTLLDGSDKEYIDLLAFAIQNNNVIISDKVCNYFYDYISKYPESEAAAEMAISLARKKDRRITPFILEALDNQPGEIWLEAAVFSADKAVKEKLVYLEDSGSEKVRGLIKEIHRNED